MLDAPEFFPSSWIPELSFAAKISKIGLLVQKMFAFENFCTTPQKVHHGGSAMWNIEIQVINEISSSKMVQLSNFFYRMEVCTIVDNISQNQQNRLTNKKTAFARNEGIFQLKSGLFSQCKQEQKYPSQPLFFGSDYSQMPFFCL